MAGNAVLWRWLETSPGGIWRTQVLGLFFVALFPASRHLSRLMAADPREEAVYMAKLAEQAERYSGTSLHASI